MPEDTNDIVIESSECQLQTIPKPKPSHSASSNKIVVLESELNSLLLARDTGVAFKIRDSVSQPRVEENQSGVLEVIKDIAIFGGAANDRCRTETISVEAYLFKISCGICFACIYFASYKAANQHKQSHKSQQEVVPFTKIHPQRIAGRHAREVLSLGDDGNAEWYDEIDVDTMNVPDIKNPNENEVAAILVVNNLKEWVQNPWTEDD
ncbi:hypothetical protein EVAR_90602_1 [Eumeta japonica]|uniref:Uncharacterized protein n=1 Tax=Eumeta variegata TaxID=151549 RepID=A0A4C1YRV9_EUMVA|nr:hypothetical protein EVAR_90602_1 [Eumeta japonica]